MPVSSKLIKIYSDISICSDKCSGVRNEPENGVIGRGFYCPYDPNGVSLMMISKIKIAWPKLNYATAKGVLILSPSTPAIAPLNPGQLTS